MASRSGRRFVPSGNDVPANRDRHRLVRDGLAFLALVLPVASGGFHRPGADGAYGIGHLPILLNGGDHMDLLQIQCPGFISELADDLDDISRIQPIHSESEFLGGFVRRTGDPAVFRIDIDEDVTSFNVLHMRNHGSPDDIRLIGNERSSVIPYDMVVRTLVGQEDHPSVQRLGGYHLRCLDEILLGIPTESVHHGTRCGRHHRDLVETILPGIEGRRVGMIHIPYGRWIKNAFSTPSLLRTIGEKLESRIPRPPCHSAGASDETAPATDLVRRSGDFPYLRIHDPAVQDRSHSPPIEFLRGFDMGYQKTGVGLLLVIPLHQRDDSGSHHLGIGLPFGLIIEAAYLTVADHTDESTPAGSMTKSHDESTVSTGLPWSRRVQTDETRIADEIEVIEFPDDLGRKERRAVPVHRIGIIHSHVHPDRIPYWMIDSYVLRDWSASRRRICFRLPRKSLSDRSTRDPQETVWRSI